ncbi:DUF2752 domain-containing protein [Streptomyces sp. NPDC006251]|uniref:DUF2752 domain-containing protein n=1 Tax=Streptomyces sp. NPDC006251 TaxID=3155718 RepID=UPI0033A0439D
MWASTARPVRDAWLGAAVCAAVAVITALVDPTKPGRFPACPFRAATGFDCPGCGSLRALHELTHGHLTAAADYNLLLVAFLPCAAAVWLGVVTGRVRPMVLPKRGASTAVMVLIMWTVIRNLPVLEGVLAA